MSGVRISTLPRGVTSKDIKIHFSKPENGGGPIKEIYYPLFDKDAVVIYVDKENAELVLCHEHILHGSKLTLKMIPVQIFPTMEAELDPDIAEYVTGSPEVKDEITISGNITFVFRAESKKYILRGNWYELESAWFYINTLMAHQKKIQKDIIKRQTSVELKRGSNSSLSSSRSTSAASPKLARSLKGSAKEAKAVEPEPKSLPNIGACSITGQVAEGSVASDQLKIQGNVEKGMSRNENTGSRCLPTSTDESPASVTSRRSSEETNKRLVQASQPRAGSADATIRKMSDTHIEILNDNPEDLTSLDFIHKKLKVFVYSGDITLEETDAIVNATRPDLQHWYGVAVAIAKMAGDKMEKECEKFISSYGKLKPCNVMHTSAGGSFSEKVKYILHTVGPNNLRSSQEEEEACGEQLAETFLNCFLYGNKKLKLRTIACPLISSGVNNVSEEVCTTAFFRAILGFSEHLGTKKQHLEEVHLVHSDSDSSALSVLHLRHLVAEGHQQTSPRYDARGPDISRGTSKTSVGGLNIARGTGTSSARGTDIARGTSTTFGRPLPPVPQYPDP